MEKNTTEIVNESDKPQVVVNIDTFKENGGKLKN